MKGQEQFSDVKADLRGIIQILYDPVRLHINTDTTTHVCVPLLGVGSPLIQPSNEASLRVVLPSNEIDSPLVQPLNVATPSSTFVQLSNDANSTIGLQFNKSSSSLIQRSNEASSSIQVRSSPFHYSRSSSVGSRPSNKASSPLFQLSKETISSLVLQSNEAGSPLLQLLNNASSSLVQQFSEASSPLVKRLNEAGLLVAHAQPLTEAISPHIQLSNDNRVIPLARGNLTVDTVTHLVGFSGGSEPSCPCKCSLVAGGPMWCSFLNCLEAPSHGECYTTFIKKKKSIPISSNQASYRDVLSFHRLPLLLKMCLAMIALLLLLAGDVERNPGPTVVTVDKVDELAALIVEEASDWYIFLGQVGVSVGKRDELKEENAGRPRAPQKCLIQGLHHWVVSDEAPTYEKVIAIFDGDFLTNKPLARKVEKFAQSITTVPLANVIGNTSVHDKAVANSVQQPQVVNLCKTHSRPPTTDVIAAYTDQIRGYYRTSTPLCFCLTWPPPPTRKIFNLSMISHKQYNYGRGYDDFVELLYHGKVDELITKKSSVNLEDLFHLDDARRKVILIEGAPGAGKSTLAWHICQKWEAGELFQEFKLVVFVQLRDPAIQSANTLADLFPSQLQHIAQEIADFVSRMETKDGEGLLFVLDGWDEFPLGLHGNNMIKNLICDSAAICMHSSTLVITSLPIASGDLHRYASARVEIVGFKQTDLNLFFMEALQNDSDMVQKLNSCLIERPLLKASCYLPLNAVIIVHLFLSLENSLPNTLHGVLLQLIIHCIARHIMKKQAADTEAPHIGSLDDLPPDMQTQLGHICAMAYQGIKKNKVKFSENDLKAFNLPLDIDTLSLIQGVVSFMPYKSRAYNFLHLSVQELLTAYYISKLPPEEQVKIFKELFGDPRFAAVFQYYAAFTKLKTAGIREVIVSIIQQKNKDLFVALLHCLYEAQDSSLCQFVAFELNGELDLSHKSLGPVDCIAVGYFIHQCAAICPMTAKLSKCSLDSYKVELLGKELKRPIQAVNFNICIDFSGSSIDSYLTQSIATELITTNNDNTEPSSSVISKLNLCGNPIQDSEDGLSHLCQALATNKSLLKLNFAGFELHVSGAVKGEMAQAIQSLQLSGKSINGGKLHSLSYFISSSSAICKLNLSHNPIQDDEDGLSHLCQALTTNTSLVELNLYKCKLEITEENGHILSHMLKTNNTLKTVILAHNSINGHGMRYFSESISSSAISELDLSGNPIQAEEDGLYHLCQALTSNTTLVELKLSRCKIRITEKSGQTLSHLLKRNKSLATLVLSHNAINGHGIHYFSDGIRYSSGISKLDLTANPIQNRDDGLLHLCQALTTNTSLLELNLSKCRMHITDHNGLILTEMLKVNTTMQVLILSNNAINGHGVFCLSDGISSSVVSKLDLSGNPIQKLEDGFSHLCQALTNNKFLIELKLIDCKLAIRNENGQALSQMLISNKTLQSLSVYPIAHIDGHGLRFFSNYIKSSLHTITTLNLSDNPIQSGEDGLCHLCEVLATNTSVVELHLSTCGLTITEQNGYALKKFLSKNKTLKVFILSHNLINGHGLTYVSEGIRSSSVISKLDLSGNPLQEGKDGLPCLYQALRTNTSLKELNLSDCSLQRAFGPPLCHMLKSNTTLTSLKLSYNNCVSDDDATYLAEGLKGNLSLKSLRLCSCGIREAGMRIIANGLMMNESLEEVDLSSNYDNTFLQLPEIAHDFSDIFLQKSNLKRLDLSWCGLTEEAVLVHLK